MKKQQGIPAAAYRPEESQERKAVQHKWVRGAHSGSKHNKSPSAVPGGLPEASPFSNSPAGARCRPGSESPAAHWRPVPGLGGVRSSPLAPTLTFPLRSPHSGAPPPSLAPPPQALPSRGCRGEEGAGKQEGCKSRSEPAVTTPPGPAAPGAGRRAHGTPQRAPAADVAAAAAAVAAAGRAAVAAQSWDPGEEEQPLGRRAATRRRQLPGCLASTPGRRGVRGKSLEESAAHRWCARSSPRLRRPVARLQSRPPRSARISGGCSARASYLRSGRAPATEHAQCRSASPAQGAAPATFHFSRLWRRLREEKLEGLVRRGPRGI
ncbi:vasodilator-stimulated phosphoprotein-like [Eptesicus fuscus]|uniref:vasodilator-stimulated phosphoprotein-like n=1 Tax=Eptesicus fuscus TaxID=29078 RepID=UPI002403B4DC|nr:vasodilator-stimulated phosphoprotein-like [Eptesicus fuscus]